MTSTPASQDRSIPELVRDLSTDVSTLVRGEVDLVKAELRQTAKHSGTGIGLFVGAAFLVLLAVVLLSIAAAYGLVAAGLDPWLAFLIVAVAFLLVATVLALVGKAQLGKTKGPRRTIQSVKDTQVAFSNHR